MRLLVLGGTKFLGRATVEAALERGDDVSIFTRGQTNADLFPDVERLRGDRDGDLGALEGRRWDAVVDTSGYVPRIVRQSAELLRDSGHYVFVSSISAYAGPPYERFDERAPLAKLDDPYTEEVMEHYGALKVACERVVEEVFGPRAALVRAGLIVGPHDPTDRFTYWPTRVARGGEVLAPGRPGRPWQFVDARDVGGWLLEVCERGHSGPFNATGPVPGVTAGDVLETARRVSGGEATFTWVEDTFLVERGVGEWMELPLWMSEAGEYARFHEWDVTRAVEAGLRFRPVEETVRDALTWASARDGRGAGTAAMGGTAGVGLDPEKERRLLHEWRATTAA